MATDYDFNGAQVKGRNPFAVLGLSIITLGIYYFVWWYKINREVRDASSGRIVVDPMMSVLAVTLGALIVVPAFVSFHKTGRRAQEMAALAGRSEGVNLLAYWLLYLFTGVGAYIYLQWELNKIWTTMQQSGATMSSTATSASPIMPA
jgi:uncharacterized membrane protein